MVKKNIRSELSTTRKKDRELMSAILIEDINDEYGYNPNVKISIDDEYELFVVIDVTHGENNAFIHISMECPKPNLFVDTWNTRVSKFSEAMEWPDNVDQAVNPYHRRKASRLSNSFEELVDTIIEDIRLLITGEGFE